MSWETCAGTTFEHLLQHFHEIAPPLLLYLVSLTRAQHLAQYAQIDYLAVIDVHAKRRLHCSFITRVLFKKLLNSPRSLNFGT
eukprot:scaffold45352_cov204-Skeletonema_marinoi.AAC.1